MIDTIKNNSPESTRQHEVDEIEDSSSGEAKSIKEKIIISSSDSGVIGKEENLKSGKG